MIRIGIIGLGFVGSAMYDSFVQKGLSVTRYDKYKTYDPYYKILECDIIFMALPTVYNEELEEYDLTAIHENLILLANYKNIIVNKSTVSPHTTENLALTYNLNIVHNPEFLTAKTAAHDFHNQSHIVLGITSICDKEKYQVLYNFYKKYYTENISECSSLESECMKIFCNSFYAAKIQFFNELYLLCNNINANYNTIKELMIKNGWINKMHTTVPGPDQKLSYGGLCFPKDTNALLSFMKKNNSEHKVLEAVINERNDMRDDHDNVKKLNI